MDSKASSWCHWMHTNRFIHPWMCFLESLKLQFDPFPYTDYKDALGTSNQQTNGSNYQAKFEVLSAEEMFVQPVHMKIRFSIWAVKEMQTSIWCPLDSSIKWFPRNVIFGGTYKSGPFDTGIFV